MTQHSEIPRHITQISDLLWSKFGASGQTLARALAKAKARLPGRVYSRAMELANAQQMASHPKLLLTLDATKLGKSAQEVETYLTAIDVKDRRKGWILGMLGGMVFNILLFVCLLIGLLFWRGFL